METKLNEIHVIQHAWITMSDGVRLSAKIWLPKNSIKIQLQQFWRLSLIVKETPILFVIILIMPGWPNEVMLAFAQICEDMETLRA
jgi:predicted acyl esterase